MVTINALEEQNDALNLRETRSSVITRASDILDAFQVGSARLMLDDLTAHTGLPRSTVFRLITQLVEVGWLERDPDLQGYRLGRKMITLGERYRGYGYIREAAHPMINELYDATGLVVHLGVLEDESTIHYLDKVGAFPGAKMPSRVGFRFPIERTTSGKAMLAAMAPSTAEGLLHKREEVHNLNLDWVRKELPAVRRNFGVATIIGGTGNKRYNAVGAPIIGPAGPIGAIAIASVEAQMRPLMPLVLAAARKVSATMHPDWHAERMEQAFSRRRVV